MKNNKIGVCAVALIISGCASTTYYNPYITEPNALNRQFTVDDAYCTRASVGSVPIPQVRTYSSGQQSYSVNGNATSYNSRTGYTDYSYSGKVHSNPSAADSFSTAFANGMNIGASIAAKNARNRVYHGCMVSLGWTTSKEEADYLSEKEASKEENPNGGIQHIIDSIPELASWQVNDAQKWRLAVSIDEVLRESPDFANIELRERLLIVVERVKKVVP